MSVFHVKQARNWNLVYKIQWQVQNHKHMTLQTSILAICSIAANLYPTNTGILTKSYFTSKKRKMYFTIEYISGRKEFPSWLSVHENQILAYSFTLLMKEKKFPRSAYSSVVSCLLGPKKICLCFNLLNLWIWPYLEKGFLQIWLN